MTKNLQFLYDELPYRPISCSIACDELALKIREEPCSGCTHARTVLSHFLVRGPPPPPPKKLHLRISYTQLEVISEVGILTHNNIHCKNTSTWEFNGDYIISLAGNTNDKDPWELNGDYIISLAGNTNDKDPCKAWENKLCVSLSRIWSTRGPPVTKPGHGHKRGDWRLFTNSSKSHV